MKERSKVKVDYFFGSKRVCRLYIQINIIISKIMKQEYI